MELSQVYPEETGLNNYTRKMSWSFEKGDFHIEDSFQFKKNNNLVIENFVSLYEPEIVDNKVLLKDDDWCCSLAFDTRFIDVQTSSYQDHRGQKRIVYLIQATFKVGKDVRLNTRMTMFKLEKESI